MGLLSIVQRPLPHELASEPRGAPTSRVRTAAGLTKEQQFAHAKALLAPLAWTPSAKLIFASIGRFESRYGLADNFLFPDGRPSYNWGALVGSGNAGSIYTSDHDKAGNLVKGIAFKAFTAALEGFDAFVRVLVHPGTGQETAAVAELNAGDVEAVATRMYKNGYYVGFGSSDAERIGGYVKAIINNARDYASSTGQEMNLSGPGGATNYVPAGSTDENGVFVLDPIIITGDGAGAPAKNDGGGGVALAFGAAAALAVGYAITR